MPFITICCHCLAIPRAHNIFSQSLLSTNPQGWPCANVGNKAETKTEAALASEELGQQWGETDKLKGNHNRVIHAMRGETRGCGTGLEWWRLTVPSFPSVILLKATHGNVLHGNMNQKEVIVLIWPMALQLKWCAWRICKKGKAHTLHTYPVPLSSWISLQPFQVGATFYTSEISESFLGPIIKTRCIQKQSICLSACLGHD